MSVINELKLGIYNSNGKKIKNIKIDPTTINQQHILIIQRGNYDKKWNGLSNEAKKALNEKSRRLRNSYLQQFFNNNKKEISEEDVSELSTINRNVLKNAIEIRGLLNDPNKTKEDILLFLRNTLRPTLHWSSRLWLNFFKKFSAKTGNVSEEQIIDVIPGDTKQEAYEALARLKAGTAAQARQAAQAQQQQAAQAQQQQAAQAQQQQTAQAQQQPARAAAAAAAQARANAAK